jgi:hypothetical protein
MTNATMALVTEALDMVTVLDHGSEVTDYATCYVAVSEALDGTGPAAGSGLVIEWNGNRQRVAHFLESVPQADRETIWNAAVRGQWPEAVKITCQVYWDEQDAGNPGWAYRYVDGRGTEQSGGLAADPDVSLVELAETAAEVSSADEVKVYQAEQVKLVYRGPNDWRWL